MAIGIEVATGTSLGTGTTKTRLNGDKNVKLPEAARQIVAVKPYLSIDTPTTLQSVWGQLSLESDDFKITPYQVLAGIIGSSIDKAGVNIGTLPETWPVNVEIPGGGELKVYGTALVANTAAPQMGCEIIISDRRPTVPQVRAKMGTITSTGTAAAEVEGTAFSFTGGRRLIEIYGGVSLTTVATTVGVSGYFRFQSSEFRPPFPTKVAFAPINGALITDATTPSALASVTHINRGRLSIGIAPAQTTVQDYCNLEQAPGTAGKFVTGVLFV